jgi:hypothetical protein
MRVWRNLTFAVFCVVVSFLASPVEVSAEEEWGCSSGSPAFWVNPECPFMEFYDASCQAGAQCGTDALDLATQTCLYYSYVYNIPWPYLQLEGFDCTDPVEEEPFDFSFVCVPPVYPCIEQ